MSKGIGITELTTILTANPRLVGAVKEQKKAGFLSSTELDTLLAGSVGTADITAGALTADAAGRAKVADGFFDNSVIAKFADALFAADAASRAKFADDLWNNAAIAKFADGLFAADAASRAKFVNAILTNAKLATPGRRAIIPIPIDDLTNLTAGGEDIATDILPGFAGTVEAIFYIGGTLATSAGAATMALHVEIGAVATTGGVLTIDEASIVTPAVLGVYVAGTPITGANAFTNVQTLSLVNAAGGTVFTAGAGVVFIVLNVAGQ